MSEQPQQPETEVTISAPEGLPAELAAEATALRDAGAQGYEEENRAPAGSVRQPADPSEFAVFVHGYVREFIALADQKAGFVFAAAAALLTYEFTQSLQVLWIRSPGDWSFQAGLSAISMSALFLAAIFAAAVVLPRRSRSHEGIVFFSSITEHRSAGAYTSAVLATPAPDLTRALLYHVYDLARICHRKYAVLAWALWLLIIGAVGGVAAVLLIPHGSAS